MFHRRDDFAKSAYKRHGRAILTDEQARAIFQVKPSPFARDRDRAGALARAYGVSVKTVRDIWVGRTWYRATFDLDPTAPISPERLHKKPGRPKGAKDSKPRVKKPVKDEEGAGDEHSPLASVTLHVSTHVGVAGDATAPSSWKLEPIDVSASASRPASRFAIDSDNAGCAGAAWAAVPGARNAHAAAEPRSAAGTEGLLPAWHDAPPGVIAPELLDPFHHDWAFWPADDSNDGGRRARDASPAAPSHPPPPPPDSFDGGCGRSAAEQGRGGAGADALAASSVTAAESRHMEAAAFGGGGFYGVSEAEEGRQPEGGWA